MSRWTVLGAGCLLVLSGLSPVWSQESAPPDKESAKAPTATSSDLSTEEQQELQRRTGTTYHSWQEMVNDFLTPRAIPKESIVRLDDTHAYPHPAVPIKMEIVREEGDTVWLRGLPPEDPESFLHDLWLRRERVEALARWQAEWEQEHGNPDHWVDFEAEVVPPPFMDALTFEPVASGLPNQGLWQMNVAIDDLDGDGTPDLLFPPSRKGTARPSIFLGRGGGVFEAWKSVTWPASVPFDYGGIATGDFDGDGQRDIVLAIHFKGQYVLYGNGQGGFGRSELLPSPDPRISSRAPAVADFDGDGRDDVAFLAEIDYDLGTSARIAGAPTAWVAMSTPKGWKVQYEGFPQEVIGDSIEATDLNGDGRIDLALASNTSGWRDLVVLNRGGDEGWVVPLQRGVLTNALHPDIAVHHGSGSAEIYAPYVQFQMVAGENEARTGIVRYPVGSDGMVEPGVPLLVDDLRFNAPFRLGIGDLNGDGRVDAVLGRRDGQLEVYLQTAGGEYSLERSEELESRGRAYDIRLVDLDGDGKDDLIIAFAGEEGAGGVRVWLTRSRV